MQVTYPVEVVKNVQIPVPVEVVRTVDQPVPFDVPVEKVHVVLHLAQPFIYVGYFAILEILKNQTNRFLIH